MSWASHPFTYRSEEGLTLAGERAGERGAQPVILLHGGGQTRHSWRRAVRELAARGYDVINLDARGHGESEWAPDGDYGFRTQSRDLDRIIATLPMKPALVGASMGGATGLILAGMRDPVPASVLVLVDIVPRMDPQGSEKIRAFMRSHPNGFETVEEAAEAVRAYNAAATQFPAMVMARLCGFRPGQVLIPAEDDRP